MRDDDTLLDLPDPEFGSGVIGICDICGRRQAVIVLEKERYKLCVLDFLNKTWLKTDRPPGVPLPPYRSERIWYSSDAVEGGRMSAIRLVPTKSVRHPVLLVAPDVYGITTTLLDGAIRFAKEGIEVLIPDLLKAPIGGMRPHLAMRSAVRFRGGVPLRSPALTPLLRAYRDGLDYLRSREMVDPARSALFGTSYGGSLALLIAAEELSLAAVAVAYPAPLSPPDAIALVTSPTLVVHPALDRLSARAVAQVRAASGPSGSPFEVHEVEGARHDFLSRDLSTYDLPRAEAAWAAIVGFLKDRLLPAPPRPVPPPIRTAPPPLPSAPARAPGTAAP
ncbi:MAG: dienelactone hydrolase family protein [Thermoplasmata archaeon]